MKRVGIYRTVFPYTSESFITEQARCLERYRPTMVCRTLIGTAGLPAVSLSDHDCCGIRQKLFTLTKSAALFPADSRLSGLDLIHAHFGPDGVYAGALAERLHIPLVVTFHGFDITCSDWSLLRSCSPTTLMFLAGRSGLKRKAAVFIAVSRFIAQLLVAHGYPADKVRQHYIGVDTAKFLPTTEKPGQRYLLCIGRHEEKKGIDTLLRAFARIAPWFPDVQLWQVGSGSLSAELEKLCDQLHLAGRVRFLGARPHGEIVGLMQGAELFVLPSQTAASGDSEALGIVFNEASACGLPVVATRHGGIPEAVLDGETGILVQERDEQRLAEGMAALLTDSDLAARMGKRGREFVEDCFDIRKQTKKLESIYDEVYGYRDRC